MVESIKRNESKTQAVWKYVLFKHNDKDEHIVKAIDLANGLGIEIQFDLATEPIASARSINEIESIVGTKKSA